MKTHLLTNQNARTIQIILQNPIVSNVSELIFIYLKLSVGSIKDQTKCEPRFIQPIRTPEMHFPRLKIFYLLYFAYRHEYRNGLRFFFFFFLKILMVYKKRNKKLRVI